MGGKSALRSVVLAAAAVAAGSLVLAAAFGSVLHWDIPGFAEDFSLRSGREAPFDESRSVPSQGIKRLAVVTVSEKTVLSACDGDDFQVRLYGTVYTNVSAWTPRLVAESEGGTLHVAADRIRTGGNGWYRGDLVLEVSVPRGFEGSLSAVSVSGAIRIADRAYRDLALSTTSGSIHAGSMKAQKISLNTTSGSLRLAAAEAESVRLSSSSGSIEAKGLAGDVRATSVSGRVFLDFRSSPSSVEAVSTSGAVEIRLPADARFALDAVSTSGSVSCDFPVTVMGNAGGRHSMTGTVNAGTQPLRVRTVSGSIRIRR